MSSLARQVAVVRDDILGQKELDALLAYAISREPDFVEAHLVNKNSDAAPVVNRHFRRNKQLRGANSVPTTVMSRIREIVPVLASELPGVQASMVAEGSFEAFLTATPSGGFFRPHVDNSHDGARDRFISFVLYFSRAPQPFTGGELCIERDWQDSNRIFMFDAARSGLGHPEIAEVVEPRCNRLVVFAAHRRHEVRPVQSLSEGFASWRFTVTGFVRSNPQAAK